MTIIAHTKNALGQRQDLEEHLRHVADAAKRSCSPFGGETFAYYAGLLHDIGKCDPAFQHYLLNAEQHPAQRTRGPDHKGAGAVLASQAEATGFLASLINGHHGGLVARADLKAKVREGMTTPAVKHAIATAQRMIPELQTLPHQFVPAHIRTPLEHELFVRMAFSGLVDADFLDTEQHFLGGKRAEREGDWPLSTLQERFHAFYQDAFADAPQSSLNTIRQEVYRLCLDAAMLPPGFFRLAVPTGGGKTLASLAFALRHALTYHQERILYAIPYTSIIDQTASVFRGVFGDAHAFIEHHSDITVQDPEKPTLAELHRRLATENWDASLIVTTTAQLFESLMSCQTGKCRKLHNIARSVIILDEVQMLPVHLLTTILDLLRQLVAHYGVTVVLCTATQPDFENREEFEGLEGIREIIPQSTQQQHFAALKRVTYQLPTVTETWTWEQVAARVQRERHMLVIVNTRRDALELMHLLTLSDMLDEEEQSALFHLSTRLCGAHRRMVLEEVRRRLKGGEECRLIATQVIEAGVDVDFPLVMRALGPLDRIVQAAGRANREGRMDHLAEVIVFVPQDGHCPKAASYLLGTDITVRLFKHATVDLHDPGLYQAYFRDYYGYPNRDTKQIEAARKRFDYPLVAEKFRMIEDETAPVLVHYPPHEDFIQKHLDILAHRSSLRETLRALQPYTVNLFTYELKKAQDMGLVREVLSGVWEWRGTYDSGADGMHGQGIVLDSSISAESLVW